jgi:hypothetical protein
VDAFSGRDVGFPSITPGRRPVTRCRPAKFDKDLFHSGYRKQWSSPHLDECYGEIVISMNITRAWLFLVAFHCAHGQSMDCSNLADTETGSKMGPGGVLAVLRVHSEDDHSKNSHQCMANYTLRITLPDGRDAAAGLIPPMGFIASIGKWGRRLSVQLDGFSDDGQHIFGLISEGGEYSSVTVFNFKRDGSHVEIRVQQGWEHLRAVDCGTSFAVAGTTKTGEVVLEPSTGNQCRADHRWLLDKTGKLRDMAQNETFVRLYNPRTP